MLRNTLLIVSLLIAGFVSAQNFISREDPKVLEINNASDDQFTSSELIEDISIQKLNIPINVKIMSEMDVKVFRGEYYILDNYYSNCILRFDKDGNMKNLIGENINYFKTNNANNVFDSNKNQVKFCVDKKDELIHIYDFANSLISKYTLDGKPQGKIQCNLLINDVVKDINGFYWYYMGWNNMDTPYRLLKIDDQGNLVTNHLFMATTSIPFEGNAFNSFRDEVLVWESLGNTTFKIANDKIIRTYKLDLGPHSLPGSYHELDQFTAYNLITQRGFYNIQTYLENDNYAYFFLKFKNKSRHRYLHVIYDKMDEQVHTYVESSANVVFNMAKALTENDELVFIVEPRRFRRMFSESPEVKRTKFAGAGTQITSSDRHHVIFKVKLRGIAGHSSDLTPGNGFNEFE